MGLENGVIKAFEERVKKLDNATKLPQWARLDVIAVKQLLADYHRLTGALCTANIITDTALEISQQIKRHEQEGG